LSAASSSCARDYFAQDAQGNVWYFGERVEDIKVAPGRRP